MANPPPAYAIDIFMTAQDLAESLLPELDAIAHIHYLLDQYVDNTEKLRELRILEEELFTRVLRNVLAACESRVAEHPGA